MTLTLSINGQLLGDKSYPSTNRGDNARKSELSSTKNEKKHFTSDFLPSLGLERPVAASQITESLRGEVTCCWKRINKTFSPSAWEFDLGLTFYLCSPGNLIKTECQLCYQATLLMIKLTLDSYTTSGRTRAINEGLLTATIILGSFECRDSYRSGPSRSVGTTEVLHVELVQEILALVGHVAFKLERLLHLPLRVFFPHTWVSPEVGEGSDSPWMLRGLLSILLWGPLLWKRNVRTALPTTCDSPLSPEEWNGARCGLWWSERDSEHMPQWAVHLPKATLLGGGRARTETQLAVFKVNIFSLIAGPKPFLLR